MQKSPVYFDFVEIADGMASFIYSFISGEKTMQNLRDMQEQYNTLVERFNLELSKANYGQENLKNIDQMLDD